MRTNKVKWLTVSLCLALFLLAWAQTTTAQGRNRPDKVRATKTIKGTLKDFQEGDYLHATIRQGKRLVSFFVKDYGLAYFLALHHGEQLTLTYQLVDTFIPEAGAVNRIERLTSARAGSLTYEKWWRTVGAKYSPDELDKKYGPLFNKYLRP